MALGRKPGELRTARSGAVTAVKARTNTQNQDEQTKKNIAAFLETCIGKPMPDSKRTSTHLPAAY